MRTALLRAWMRGVVVGACAAAMAAFGTAAPAAAQVVSDLNWSGVAGDVVAGSEPAMRDGVLDGQFVLDIDAPQGAVVEKIELFTVGEDGKPCCGQVWSTQNPAYWLLGASPPGQALFNRQHRPRFTTLPAGRTRMTLHVNDSGWFREGQSFAVIVSLPDGGRSTAHAAILRGSPPAASLAMAGRWRSSSGSIHEITPEGAQTFSWTIPASGERGWGFIRGEQVSLWWNGPEGGVYVVGPVRRAGGRAQRVDFTNGPWIERVDGGGAAGSPPPVVQPPARQASLDLSGRWYAGSGIAVDATPTARGATFRGQLVMGQTAEFIGDATVTGRNITIVWRAPNGVSETFVGDIVEVDASGRALRLEFPDKDTIFTRQGWPPGMSKLCHFDRGPRSGQMANFGTVVGIPFWRIGDPCTDGRGSSGVAVALPQAGAAGPAPTPPRRESPPTPGGSCNWIDGYDPSVPGDSGRGVTDAGPHRNHVLVNGGASVVEPIRQRLATLQGCLSGETYARLYADASVLVGRYGRATLGWLDGQDGRYPADSGRGVSDWQAHYDYAARGGGGIPDYVSRRVAAIVAGASNATAADLYAELAVLIARYAHGQGGGRPTTPAPTGTVRARLSWSGTGGDMVTGAGSTGSDGVADGRFYLALDLGAPATVRSIELATTDADGRPCCGQVWSTDNPAHWLLAGAMPDGRLYQRMKAPTFATLSPGAAPILLLANDSGWFRQGQAFTVTVTLATGEQVRAMTVIGGAPAVASGGRCELAGRWRMSTEGVGESDWTFTRLPSGRYRGQEAGLGSAAGEAAFDGRRFDMPWATGGFSGDLAVTLEADCNRGNGSHSFRTGRSGTFPTSWRRLP